MSDFEFINKEYSVPAEKGRAVIVNGKHGVIVECRGNYIGVNFDDDKAGFITNCHPTWEVIYGDIVKIRQLTRSQHRYQEYLYSEEGYTSFAGFLGIRK